MVRSLIRELPGFVGSRVTVAGFVTSVRSFKSHQFVLVRDRSGTCQSFLPRSIHNGMVRPEDVVRLVGVVAEIPGPTRGRFEIVVESIEFLAQGASGTTIRASEVHQLSLKRELDNRAASLRLDRNRAIFALQSMLFGEMSSFLRARDFLEVKTPTVIASCLQGGAALFPVDFFGNRAALSQSPQLYHQMLMAAFERVFEICPVFRAEKYATSRHLSEFTILQVSVAFITNEHDLLVLLEDLIRFLIRSHFASDLPAFPRLTYQSCATLIGRSFGSKLGPEEKRTISEFIATKHSGAEFAFITHLPRSLVAFNAMPENDSEARAFKLLFRGQEIASGAQRIHASEQLKTQILASGLEITEFTPYLQAFECGIPPHGGFSVGINRLTALLSGEDDVRRTALFPRTPKRLTP
jgi:nondiscriminating aspartyl-tRNA synthetase